MWTNNGPMCEGDGGTSGGNGAGAKDAQGADKGGGTAPAPIEMKIGDKTVVFKDVEEMKAAYAKAAGVETDYKATIAAIEAGIVKGDESALRHMYKLAKFTPEQVEEVMENRRKRLKAAVSDDDGSDGDDSDTTDDTDGNEGADDSDAGKVTLKQVLAELQALKGRKVKLSDFDPEAQKVLGAVIERGRDSGNLIARTNQSDINAEIANDRVISGYVKHMTDTQRARMLRAARADAGLTSDARPLNAEGLSKIRDAARTYLVETYGSDSSVLAGDESEANEPTYAFDDAMLDSMDKGSVPKDIADDRKKVTALELEAAARRIDRRMAAANGR